MTATAVMPVKEDRVRTDKNRIEVRDAIGRRKFFNGKIIWDGSWKIGRNLPRWTDMFLYRMDSGPYVLWTIGRSVLYHDPDGRCRYGVRTTVGAVYKEDQKRYDELEPCPICKPKDLDDVLDQDLNTTFIAVEEDRYTLKKCATAEDLIEELRDDETGEISGLAIRLLKNAANEDPDIDRVVNNTVTEL